MINPPRLKIYLAHALTKASSEYKESLEHFRRYIEEKHPEWEMLSFFGLGPSPSDGKIAAFDIAQVLKAHLVVAFTDVDSTGMGEESGVRLALGLPILFVAQNAWVRTRMVTGPARLWKDRVLFERYSRIEDVEDVIVGAIKHFKINPSLPLPRRLSVAPHFQDLYKKKVLYKAKKKKKPTTFTFFGPH